MTFHNGRTMMYPATTDDTVPSEPVPGDPNQNPNNPPNRETGESDADYFARTRDAVVPGGPLGGPVPKTRIRMLAEDAIRAQPEKDAIEAEIPEAKADMDEKDRASTEEKERRLTTPGPTVPYPEDQRQSDTIDTTREVDPNNPSQPVSSTPDSNPLT